MSWGDPRRSGGKRLGRSFGSLSLALRCRSTRRRYCRTARRWTKAWQKNGGSDKIPYFLSLPCRRTDSINLLLSETLYVFLCVIKYYMYSFKAFLNVDKLCPNRYSVDRFLSKLTIRAELPAEKTAPEPINPASPDPQPIRGLYLCLGGDNVPTRGSRTSSKQKRKERKQGEGRRGKIRDIYNADKIYIKCT